MNQCSHCGTISNGAPHPLDQPCPYRLELIQLEKRRLEIEIEKLEVERDAQLKQQLAALDVSQSLKKLMNMPPFNATSDEE